MEFDLQPTLKGNLIEVRPLAWEDFDALLQAASDPLIWEQHPERDRYQKPIFEKFFQGAMDSGGAFAVIDRKSGRIIGSSRYYNLSATEGEVEIGFTFLERAFWGGAYNSELKSLMLQHAFRFVERVIFVVGLNNLRSQKALEKIGAKFLRKVARPARDGTMDQHLVFAVARTTARAEAKPRP